MGCVTLSQAGSGVTATAAPVGELEPVRGVQGQWDRRDRILDAALAAASAGGYEAVQMRVVAERAGVAIGTLYRYFPSKVHLLVSALCRQFERVEAADDRADRGGTAYQRLSHKIGQLNRVVQRDPLLAEAMTRAFVFADASAAGEVERVAALFDRIFARTIAGQRKPSERHHQIARVISEVWLSNLLAWVTRRASITDVGQRLDIVVRLLVGDGHRPTASGVVGSGGRGE
ncbi:TetR family transcriptional regulator [Mycolicibacter icosiumassiliensis]|uniref:TetR family transcriptional regulator n=1 Tax=Mycolicibacter icosiumassiliensis TaxID=1792835 RepID=UPI00098F2B25